MSYFQNRQYVMIFFSEFHVASHLPQKRQARLNVQKGLHQLELGLDPGHLKLEVLDAIEYMAETVYPNMGHTASKSKEAQQELCFFLVQEIPFGTAALIRVNP